VGVDGEGGDGSGTAACGWGGGVGALLRWMRSNRSCHEQTAPLAEGMGHAPMSMARCHEDGTSSGQPALRQVSRDSGE
jgi:hypothetical protein